jgi:chromosome segregation ATPase
MKGLLTMTQSEQRAVYEKIEEVKDTLRDKMDERFDQIRESISDLKEYVHKNNHIKVEVEKNSESIARCSGLIEKHLVECRTLKGNKTTMFKKRVAIVGWILTGVGLLTSVVLHLI